MGAHTVNFEEEVVKVTSSSCLSLVKSMLIPYQPLLDLDLAHVKKEEHHFQQLPVVAGVEED